MLEPLVDRSLEPGLDLFVGETQPADARIIAGNSLRMGLFS